MATRHLCLLLLAISIPLAGAQTTAPPAPSAQGPVRISILNEYVVDLNFGPLGGGERHGTDKANGVLSWDGGKYVGTLTAGVDSWQTIEGLVGNCGPGHYEQTQELDVVGTDVTGFNPEVQNVTLNRATSTGAASSDYLLLKFTPGSAIPLPARNANGELSVACHTLIEMPQGPPFLPLNDSRWTMREGGYIIVLPASGVLNYTDDTASGVGHAYSPIFNVSKSLWTIQVERLQ